MGIFKKTVFLFLLISVTAGVFAERLFYLSTDRTFAVDEQKRIKVESNSWTSELRIRVYRINDVKSYYLTQADFHRPTVKGRKLRYFTPEVVTGFAGYVRGELRQWARNSVPALNRSGMIDLHPEFSDKKNEDYYYPHKIVNMIEDPNFSLVKERRYVFQERYSDWNHNYIFLEGLEKGTYLVEGITDYNVAYTVLNVSDYGFIAKRSDDKLLIYTVDNATGERRGNVELTFYNRFKKQLASTKSGGDGLAETSIKENDLFILARSEDGVYTFFDPRYFPSNVRDDYVYMYTDRPVYKGSDEVNLKGVIRNYGNDAYSLPGNQEINLEIIDSRGTVITSLGAAGDKEGLFSAAFTLPPDVTTGRYLILATINDPKGNEKKYEAEFKVEYYKKPEFQVFVKPERKVYVKGASIEADISAVYYFGDPVARGTVQYAVYRSRFVDEGFSLEQDSSFYLSEAEYVYSQMELLEQGETALDDEGRASISLSTDEDDTAYYYSIKAVVENEAGIPIAGSSQVMVVPSNLKIGVDADKFVYMVGEKINLTLFTRDYADTPLEQQVHVKVTSDGEVLYDKDVKTASNGKKMIDLKANKNGFVTVNVTGKDKEGNQASNEHFVWIGEDGASYSYAGGLVKLLLDKKYYASGENANLLIVSPVSDIDFLFTIEGDSIYKKEVQKLSANSAVVKIPVKSSYLPNVFATISFMFDNRLYSNTIKLTVPPVEKFLNISVSSDKAQYKTRETGSFEVVVTDKDKKPVANADLSVAVVDEAIYGISKEIAVDVHKYFYPMRRNNVMSWSSIGYRFYGYAMNARTELARMFDKDLTGLAAFKEGGQERKEFKDTVLWIPSVKTDKNGKAKFSVDFPDNITRWRVTVVGIDSQTRVGKGLGGVITKNEFFGSLSMPSYLNELDKTTFYSTVYNYSGEKLKATVTLGGDLLTVGQEKQIVDLEPGGSKTLEWSVSASDIGRTEVTLNCVSDKKFKDKVTYPLQILPHSIYQVKGENKKLTGSDKELSFSKPANIKKKGQKLQLNLAHSYASVIVDATPYLVKYPWGCVEQTTSAFLPNLVAAKALKKAGISLPGYEKELAENIKGGLARLYNYQGKGGSWGWFSADTIDIFMTAYVLYALTLTGEAGYDVSQTVLEKGLAALDKNMQKSQNTTEFLFGMYVLAMNDKKVHAAYENIMGRADELSAYDLALFTLISGYYDKEKGKELAGKLEDLMTDGGRSFYYWGEEDTYNWYEDSIETTAWVVRAIHSAKPDSKVITGGVDYLLSERSGNRWKSTRDTSAVIFALSSLIETSEMKNKGPYKISLNNKEVGTIDFDKGFTAELVLDDPDLQENNIISVSGIKGGGSLFLNMNLGYYTEGDSIRAASAGVTVNRSYYSLTQYSDRGVIKYRRGPKVSEVTKGDIVLVELDVVSENSSGYMFVEDYIPPGCVAADDFLLYNVSGISSRNKPDFIDFRDTKVGFFLDRARSVKLYYAVNAVYTGTSAVLPAMGQLMYFPGVTGNSADDKITIR